MTILQRLPLLLILLTLVLVVIFRFVFPDMEAILNIHDTYIVFSYKDIVLLWSVYLLLLLLSYALLQYAKLQLFVSLTHWHLGLNFIGIVAIMGLQLLCDAPDRSFDGPNYELYLLIALGIWILAQLLFPINILASIIKRKIKTRRAS